MLFVQVHKSHRVSWTGHLDRTLPGRRRGRLHCHHQSHHLWGKVSQVLSLEWSHIFQSPQWH